MKIRWVSYCKCSGTENGTGNGSLGYYCHCYSTLTISSRHSRRCHNHPCPGIWYLLGGNTAVDSSLSFSIYPSHLKLFSSVWPRWHFIKVDLITWLPDENPSSECPYLLNQIHTPLFKWHYYLQQPIYIWLHGPNHSLS